MIKENISQLGKYMFIRYAGKWILVVLIYNTLSLPDAVKRALRGKFSVGDSVL